MTITRKDVDGRPELTGSPEKGGAGGRGVGNVREIRLGVVRKLPGVSGSGASAGCRNRSLIDGYVPEIDEPGTLQFDWILAGNPSFCTRLYPAMFCKGGLSVVSMVFWFWYCIIVPFGYLVVRSGNMVKGKEKSNTLRRDPSVLQENSLLPADEIR
ncbi:hypothetical protein IEQ34_002330 [Dendrobium chrysotoxum]|uniref:Transmembrane protein n=1 Tax=Dendrobium chrysotoxum TaxID=161865 RepID=A0AAV7HNL4_DENCH|nr:hypothetical protein IEQ34_002330 [Dendrobium chrysotoxum]